MVTISKGTVQSQFQFHSQTSKNAVSGASFSFRAARRSKRLDYLCLHATGFPGSSTSESQPRCNEKELWLKTHNLQEVIRKSSHCGLLRGNAFYLMPASYQFKDWKATLWTPRLQVISPKWLGYYPSLLGNGRALAEIAMQRLGFCGWELGHLDIPVPVDSQKHLKAARKRSTFLLGMLLLLKAPGSTLFDDSSECLSIWWIFCRLWLYRGFLGKAKFLLMLSFHAHRLMLIYNKVRYRNFDMQLIPGFPVRGCWRF